LQLINIKTKDGSRISACTLYVVFPS
jgi:hypothetical protein